jgi:transposase
MVIGYRTRYTSFTQHYDVIKLSGVGYIQCEQESHEIFDGEIEVDESYFGGTRKGKRGRGSGGKVPVFGLLKRGGKVYTKIITDAPSSLSKILCKR